MFITRNGKEDKILMARYSIEDNKNAALERIKIKMTPHFRKIDNWFVNH